MNNDEIEGKTYMTQEELEVFKENKEWYESNRKRLESEHEDEHIAVIEPGEFEAGKFYDGLRETLEEKNVDLNTVLFTFLPGDEGAGMVLGQLANDVEFVLPEEDKPFDAEVYRSIAVRKIIDLTNAWSRGDQPTIHILRYIQEELNKLESKLKEVNEEEVSEDG